MGPFSTARLRRDEDCREALGTLDALVRDERQVHQNIDPLGRTPSTEHPARPDAASNRRKISNHRHQECFEEWNPFTRG